MSGDDLDKLELDQNRELDERIASVRKHEIELGLKRDIFTNFLIRKNTTGVEGLAKCEKDKDVAAAAAEAAKTEATKTAQEATDLATKTAQEATDLASKNAEEATDLATTKCDTEKSDLETKAELEAKKADTKRVKEILDLQDKLIVEMAKETEFLDNLMRKKSSVDVLD
jgi:cell division septum initiation protein DivIVA